MLDEATVRRIVRDELRVLLMEMQTQADYLDRGVYPGMVEVVRETGRPYHRLPHCPRRTHYTDDACICGVDDTKET